jgi:hypothetical protein
MNIYECRVVRDAIKQRVNTIVDLFETEREFDEVKIRELISFCLKAQNGMVGPILNVGEKIAELASTAAKNLKMNVGPRKCVKRLQADLHKIDRSIQSLKPLNYNEPSDPTE